MKSAHSWSKTRMNIDPRCARFWLFWTAVSFIIKYFPFTHSHSTPFFLRAAKGDSVRSGETCSVFLSAKGLVAAIFMLGVLSGCITDATVDLTKAPFDASTELTDATTGAITKLTDGTSQATTDLTEPTREFLSSTTPGAWFHSDGTLNPDHEKIAFVVLNFDHLQDEIARGGGEYLVSLSMLVGVPPNSRERFLKSAQSHYGYIFEEGQARPEALRRLIQTLQIMSFPS